MKHGAALRAPSKVATATLWIGRKTAAIVGGLRAATLLSNCCRTHAQQLLLNRGSDAKPLRQLCRKPYLVSLISPLLILL
jgi:hypothetical protein